MPVCNTSLIPLSQCEHYAKLAAIPRGCRPALLHEDTSLLLPVLIQLTSRSSFLNAAKQSPTCNNSHITHSPSNEVVYQPEQGHCIPVSNACLQPQQLQTTQQQTHAAATATKKQGAQKRPLACVRAYAHMRRQPPPPPKPTGKVSQVSVCTAVNTVLSCSGCSLDWVNPAGEAGLHRLLAAWMPQSSWRVRGSSPAAHLDSRLCL